MQTNNLFQELFDFIAPFFPVDWQQAIFYAEYQASSYSMEFYVKLGNNWIKCYDLPNASIDALLSLYSNIDILFNRERNSLTDDDIWTTFTLSITSSGHFKADYDYNDHTDDNYEYKMAWKKHYLI